MSKQYNKPWLSDEYKARVCLTMILEFMRGREADTMGEWGTSTKEYRLVEFQQRIGRKITPDDLVDTKILSNNPKSVRQRKWREWVKKKKDYEDLLKRLRENAINK
jgi:hypothetical protein